MDVSKVWVGDIEADGLYHQATKIHCIGVYNGSQMYGFCDEYQGKFWVNDTIQATVVPLSKFKDFLSKFAHEGLAMHNVFGYDLPMLKKHMGIEYTDKSIMDIPTTIIDTDLLSKFELPDRPGVTGTTKVHGLEAWALRGFGRKPVVTDWENCNIEVYLERMFEDIVLNRNVLLHLADSWVNLDKPYWKCSTKITYMMGMQACNGQYFDSEQAKVVWDEIDADMKQLEQVTLPVLPRPPVPKSRCYAKKDGEGRTIAYKMKGDHKPPIRVEANAWDKNGMPLEEPTMDSSFTKEWLIQKGWEPSIWNYKKGKDNKLMRDDNGDLIPTTPRYYDSQSKEVCLNLLRLDPEWAELGKNIATWYTLRHRKGFVGGLLEKLKDGKVHGGRTGITPTHRQKHAVVANAPKAKENVLYGEKIRSLFWVPNQEYVIVGCDAAGLEGRGMGHCIYPFTGGPELAHEVIDGDIHSKNARYVFFSTEPTIQHLRPEDPGFDKEDPVFSPFRDLSKNGFYACMYGATGKRLAATIGCTESEANLILEDFWRVNTSLGEFKDHLIQQWTDNNKKFITGVDGRRLFVRSKHSLVNLAIQSLGAIAMDIAGCFMYDRIQAVGLGRQMLYYHDEYEYYTKKENAELVGQIMEQSIRDAGKYLKLNVPLEAEAKIGKTWAEVH